jgi:hypothetical protein
MSATQIIVAGIFLGTLAFLVLGMAGWDVYLAARFGVDATISRSMQRLGFRDPVIAFAVGFLCVGSVFGLAAHFWWPQAPLTYDSPILAFALGALGAGLTCLFGAHLFWSQPPLQ